MLKNVLKSIAVLLIYFLISFAFEKLFLYVLVRDKFLEIDPVFVQLVETLIIIFFIIISIVYIKKVISDDNEKIRIQPKWIVIAVGLAIIFRIIEDPLLRKEIIFGEINLPDNINYVLRGNLELAVIIMNSVLLIPISEELIFRKIMLNFYSSKYLFLGILISSLLFSLIHINFDDINFFILLIFFVFGFFASIIYVRFGLIYSIIFHGGFNLIWFLTVNNFIDYWGILKKLDFGYFYWIPIIISALGGIYFLIISIKGILKNEILYINSSKGSKTSSPSIYSILIK